MARPMSSLVAYSSGLWLTPSLQRTNSIEMRHRSATADASCVAPEGRDGAVGQIGVTAVWSFSTSVTKELSKLQWVLGMINLLTVRS